MIKEDHQDFENSTKCWICDNAYVDGDVKVRGSAHRQCNIYVKLNHKIPIVFQSLKNMTYILLCQN